MTRGIVSPPFFLGWLGGFYERMIRVWRPKHGFCQFSSSKVNIFSNGKKFHLAISKTHRNPPSDIACYNSTPNGNGIPVFRYIGHKESKNKNKIKMNPSSPSRGDGRYRGVFWSQNYALTSRKCVLSRSIFLEFFNCMDYTSICMCRYTSIYMST